MTKQPERPTAKIYQFPAKPRATSASPQQTAGTPSRRQMVGFQHIVYGSAWYHDEAMEQSDADCGYQHQQH